MSLRVAIAFVLAVYAVAASAQLYRWSDEKGRVHITDTPPPASARGAQRLNVPGNTVAAQAPYELERATEAFPVTLYTSPSCKAPCASARSALNKRGVPFKEVQVWDEASNAELKQVSRANEVPTLVVGRSVHVGFEQGAFDRLLDAARYPKAGAIPARSQGAPEPPEGYVAQSGRDGAEPAPGAEPEEPAAQGPYAPRPPPPARK